MLQRKREGVLRMKQTLTLFFALIHSHRRMQFMTADSKTALALLRATLGIVQMSGAVATAIFLLRFGVDELTVASAKVSLVALIISVLLFRVFRVQEKGRIEK